MKQNQETEILNYLKQGNTLTSLESLEKMGCFRLASRISDLKKQGYEIHREMIKLPNWKHVAKYRMKTLEEICV